MPRVVVAEDPLEASSPPAPCPKAPTWHSPTPCPQPLPVKMKRRHVARAVALAVDHEEVLAQAEAPAHLQARAAPARRRCPGRPARPRGRRRPSRRGDDVAHRAHRRRSGRRRCATSSGRHPHLPAVVPRGRGPRTRPAGSAPPPGTPRGRRCGHEADLRRPRRGSAPRRPARCRRGRGRAGPRGPPGCVSSASSPLRRPGPRREACGTRAETSAGGPGAPARRGPAIVTRLGARDRRVRAQRVVGERGERSPSWRSSGGRAALALVRAARRGPRPAAGSSASSGASRRAAALVPAQGGRPGGGRRCRGASSGAVAGAGAALAAQHGREPRYVQPRSSLSVAGPCSGGRGVAAAAPATSEGDQQRRVPVEARPRRRAPAAAPRCGSMPQAARSGRAGHADAGRASSSPSKMFAPFSVWPPQVEV